MHNTNKAEDAARQMEALLSQDIVKSLHEANEANTRLRLIDRVLEILGWSRDEFNPELATSTGDFTDYRLSIDGTHRLIVEAKKVDRIAPLKNPLRKPEYENGYLHKNCGQEMTKLLEQCKKYCDTCAIRYAVATTGDIWIVIANFMDGIEWGKLRAVVFHSLEDVYQHFDDFYNLISRDAVARNSLRDKFSSLTPRPRFALRPSDVRPSAPVLRTAPNWQIIEAFFEHFMGDITRPSQEELLDECYVADHNINEYSRDLEQLLKYNPVLDELKDSFPEADSEALEKEVDFQLSSGNPKVILLVGHVGAGKTTFVRRFMREQMGASVSNRKAAKRGICVVVDLLNRSSVDVQPNRQEENGLSGQVLKELANRYGDKLYPYDPDVLKGCFAEEVKQFKAQMFKHYANDPVGYERMLAEHLLEPQKDKTLHLINYIKYARKKGYRTWIVFDNIDRGYSTYQQFVYNFAHLIAAEAGCVTMMTLREDTYIDMQAAKLFDTRYSDKIFRIYAPSILKVVAKRRRFVDRLIEENKLPKPFRSHKALVTLLNWHLKKLITGGNKSVRELLSAYCINNLREELDKLKAYYASYHSTFHNFYHKYSSLEENLEDIRMDYHKEYTRLVQSLMLGHSWSYEEGTVFNIFSVSDSEKTSHFLKLRILAYFNVRRLPFAKASMSMLHNSVVDDFVFLGYPRNQIKEAIRALLQGGLLVSPDLPVTSDGASRTELPATLPPHVKLSLSSRGLYYLRTLATHHYYQTRVGEDTVWYDEEMVKEYIEYLELSALEQGEEREDILQVTGARDVFLTYLQNSLSQEVRSRDNTYQSTDWSRSVNYTVERMFLTGDEVAAPEDGTSSNGHGDEEQSIERAAHADPDPPAPVSALVSKRSTSKSDFKQMQLFGDHEPDIEETVSDAIGYVGELPIGLVYDSTRYIVRILWALEVAYQAGLGSLRAGEIARIIRKFGKETVEPTNVARFIRTHKHDSRYADFWKEEKQGYFTIGQQGRDLLYSLLNSHRVVS